MDKNSSENLKDNLNDNNKSSSRGSTGGGSDGGSSGGESEASSGNSSTNINKTKEIPSDINTQNCGFYYRDYGVCAGKCPAGNCVSDGRSCYCKRI